MLSTGEKINHYEITRLLGKGGMGEVYLAKDTALDRNVALKFLPEELEKDEKTQKRFLIEAKSAASLDHPFICKMYEAGESSGKAFIAMEYVEGQTLKDRIEKEPLDIKEALRLVLEIAEALEKAHKSGIVHRDLKPANIMITPQGHAKVMDFGLAKRVLPTGEEELTKTLTQASFTEQGTITGTLAYMSPEQARGEKIDGRSDIFALGIILYEMTSGKHPFTKPSPIETLSAILRDPPPYPNLRPKSINPILAPVLRRTLAKDLDKRYQSIEEFIANLRKMQREITGESRLLFRRLPVIAAGLFAVALVIIAILRFVMPHREAPPSKGPEPISVIITDVQNKTGDPVFDGVLEITLNLSLDNASFITVFDKKMAHSEALKLKPGSEGRIDFEMAQLICRSKGINAVINTAIEPSDGGYLVRAWAVDPSSLKELTRADQKIGSKQAVLKVSDVLAARLQVGLVEIPPDSTRALMKETFTTSSLEAMKAYAEAQQLDALGKEEEAIHAYQRAIDHDPNFARAYAGLAVSYYARRDFQNSEKDYKKALDLIAQMPDLMTDREKYRTRGGYYLFKQNYKRAIEEYSALVKQFPRDLAGHTNLALAYFFGYQMQEAFEEGLLALELDPQNLDYRFNQSWYALASGNFERARQEAHETLRIEPRYEKAFVVLALADLAQDMAAEAAEKYRQAEGLSPYGASLASTGLADLALYEGRAEEAVMILKKGMASDLENKSTYLAADKYLMLGQAYLLQGKKSLAVESADKAVSTYGREEIQFAAAQIYIEAGEEEKARKIAGELGRKVQDIHLAYGKLIGGYLSLKRGDATNALKLFDEAQGLVDTWLGRFALSRAYLEAGAYREAYAEFEKCEKRRGEALSVFLNDLPTSRYLDTLYYYIGRTQEGQGSPAAKDSYQKFLEIRAKADAGDGLVDDARRRLNSE